MSNSKVLRKKNIVMQLYLEKFKSGNAEAIFIWLK
jgi:hypothetical protein